MVMKCKADRRHSSVTVEVGDVFGIPEEERAGDMLPRVTVGLYCCLKGRATEGVCKVELVVVGLALIPAPITIRFHPLRLLLISQSQLFFVLCMTR